MDGCEGCGAVAGVGVEGDAVEGMDVGNFVGVVRSAHTGWGRRGGDVEVGGDEDGGVIEGGSMGKFGAEVVLPAVIEGGVGDACGAHFGGEGNAGAIEGEEVVRDGDGVDGHDGDEDHAGEWETMPDLSLIVADENHENDGEEDEEVTVG